MSPAQAERLLRDLARYFEEPVLPVSRYCKAISTWVKRIETLNEGMPSIGKQGYSYHHLLGRILMDIRKSNLLWRLIYAGEPLRTTPCPKHAGKHHGTPDCPHGCGESGWLPEPRPPEEPEVVVLDLVETRGRVSPVAFTGWLALQGYAPVEPRAPAPSAVFWARPTPVGVEREVAIRLPRDATDPTWPRSIETALGQLTTRTGQTQGEMLRAILGATRST